MQTKEVTVGLESGLEARAIAKLVQVATQFSCKITAEYNGRRIEPRSLMGAMNLAASYGEKITFTTDGEGEEEALKALEDYLNGK